MAGRDAELRLALAEETASYCAAHAAVISILNIDMKVVVPFARKGFNCRLHQVIIFFDRQLIGLIRLLLMTALYHNNSMRFRAADFDVPPF